MMKSYEHIGVKVPEILLPNDRVDMTKWSVIACDQYTSSPEYWEKVARVVGDAPSTLNLVFPEVYLKEKDKAERIENIQRHMREYLDDGLLEPCEGVIYVERRVGSKVRPGLVLALDLEKYDFSEGSKSLIRATEGTIVDRLPPRMEIRKGAPLELPHILVAIDDREGSVIEPLADEKDSLEQAYDFELMLDSGHLSGWWLDEERTERVFRALERLADPEAFKGRYGVDSDDVLLFAMGDGNHSLATAKRIWEETKDEKGVDHPSRYALVEVVNIHSDAIVFEPIHRAVFGLKGHVVDALREEFGGGLDVEEASSLEEMREKVEASEGQTCGLITPEGYRVVTFTEPSSSLSYGTLQGLLNGLLERGEASDVDYVHGTGTAEKLGQREGHAVFFMKPITKESFFRSVVVDGALPRKTFSMGEAEEKRFYTEARRIQ